MDMLSVAHNLLLSGPPLLTVPRWLHCAHCVVPFLSHMNNEAMLCPHWALSWGRPESRSNSHIHGPIVNASSLRSFLVGLLSKVDSRQINANEQ